MDINTLRIMVTVTSFAAFIAIVWWATSRHNRQRFDEAAQLPFTEKDPEF